MVISRTKKSCVEYPGNDYSCQFNLSSHRLGNFDYAHEKGIAETYRLSWWISLLPSLPAVLVELWKPLLVAIIYVIAWISLRPCHPSSWVMRWTTTQPVQFATVSSCEKKKIKRDSDLHLYRKSFIWHPVLFFWRAGMGIESRETTW